MIVITGLIIFLIFLKQFEIAAKQNPYLVTILIISFFVKLILLLLSENNIIRLVDGGSDTVNFITESIRIYNANEFFGFLTYNNPEGNYPYFLSMVYVLTYPSHLVILFFGILLHNSIIIIMSKILDFFYLSKRNKFLLVLLVSFFPIILSYSVILLREIIYIWYITFLCYNIVYYNCNKKFAHSGLLIFIISLSVVFLHVGNLAIIFGAFILFYKFNRLMKYSLIILLVFGFSYLVTNNMASGYVNRYSVGETELLISEINASRESSSAYYEKFYSSNIINNVFFALPLDFINFYFTPFVYPISNVYKRLLRYPYGLLSLYLFFIVLKNYRYASSNEKKMVLLLLVGMFPFVIGSGDLFQAVRHRMNFFPLIIVLIAMFNQTNKRQHKDVK